MKANHLLPIFFAAAVLLAGGCDDNGDTPDKPDKPADEYPVTTVVGERTCEGVLAGLPNPPDGSDEPVVPGVAMGLETSAGNYLLTRSGQWIWDETSRGARRPAARA